MNLEAIPSGGSIVLDANILLYAIQTTSHQCRRLLERCVSGDVTGMLPLHMLAEIMHILMLAEARDYGWVAGSNPARKLAAQPDRVRNLVRYEGLIRDLLAAGFLLEPLRPEDFPSAIELTRRAGILTNDSLLVALCLRVRVTALASADRQFSRAPGITLYAPDDIDG